MTRRIFILTLLAGLASTAWAQLPIEELPLYYVTAKQASVFRKVSDPDAYIHLRFRDPVYVIEHLGAWSRIRTKDGAQGFIRTNEIHNVWLRVSKTKQTIYVYRGTELVETIAADLGYNTFADKERRGSLKDRDHWRTPEGTFTIIKKNPNSTFHKALIINYPNSEDAIRGLKSGLISHAQYASIVRAEAEGEMPPMNTPLGGMIEIHGNGTGARSNWTQGCIAVRNDNMDRLYAMVPIGAPVLVER